MKLGTPELRASMEEMGKKLEAEIGANAVIVIASFEGPPSGCAVAGNARRELLEFLMRCLAVAHAEGIT